MDREVKVRRRRRAAVSCTECRKHKKRCDRKLPCALCVLRGATSSCSYDGPLSFVPHEGASVLPANTVAPGTDTADTVARSYHPFSNDDESLTSMGLLKKVISNVEDKGSGHTPATQLPSEPQKNASDSSLYFNYVRRLPSIAHCEILFQYYFAGPNNMHSSIDEGVFREHWDAWWKLAHKLLPKHGPEEFPKEIRCYPAIVFQVIALALQCLPASYDARLDELRFSPSQTLNKLSEEWAGCGVAVTKLLSHYGTTFLDVQCSLLYDIWLCNTGDLLRSWEHSGKTIRLATSIGLHLEPQVVSSSRGEELLENLWFNEQKKRVWVNLLIWDSPMAMVFGRPAYMNIDEASISPPLDCWIPKDRRHHLPVGRSESDGPTPMTERLLQYQVALRIKEVRELEKHGSIPANTEKVKELHRFALDFRKSLPPFFQQNPDTTWDAEHPFVPIHREILTYLIESFLVALHRPYVMTREQSQRQVYASVLTILDSQDRLEEYLCRNDRMAFPLGIVFPTFDAAMMLAVILVLRPERYRSSFTRPYLSLKRAVRRLKEFASTIPLAKSGADLLERSIGRVSEAHKGSGGIQVPSDEALEALAAQPPSSESSLSSPGDEKWHFELDHNAMDWSIQNLELEFDLSNVQAPVPLKELLLDEATSVGGDGIDLAWTPWQQQTSADVPILNPQTVMDIGENALWMFLTDNWAPEPS